MEHNTNTETVIKEKTSAPRSKKFLVVYSTALFLLAGLLIGLSYFSQARVAVDTNKKLNEISTGVQTRLEQVSIKNDELEQENAALKAENEDLSEKLKALENSEEKILALEYLLKIEMASIAKKKNTCKDLIAEFDEKGLRTFLSQDALSELVRIEENL